MSTVGRAHALLAKLAPEVCLEPLAHGPVRDAIRRAVAAGQLVASRRGGCLTRELSLWLLLSMALWRHLSIRNALCQMLEALPLSRDLGPRPVTDGAIAHARERLGVEPARLLFREIGAWVNPPPTFHGRRVWAVDGMKTTVPDTPENVETFGRPSSMHEALPFPQLLLVTLGSVHCLGATDLLLGDRGIHAAWLAEELSDLGVHYLLRIPSTVKPTILHRRGPGDYDVEIHREKYQCEGPNRERGGRTRDILFRARMIVYKAKGSTEEVRLLTSLVEVDVTAEELAALYHLRWEEEMSFDETETHLMATLQGTCPTTFRGRSPAMVEQEIWAMLATYNLIRHLMKQAATRHDLPPIRLSFVDCTQVIARWCGKPSPEVAPGSPWSTGQHLTHLYNHLLDDLAQCSLERPRRPRKSPRKVHSRSQFPTKKPGDRCIAFHYCTVPVEVPMA
jgi:hypothetical protein